jgi:predicted Zn-dependent peptidase
LIHFKKSELKNGIRVVSELHSQSRAVALGLWVMTGTRDESDKDAGISHFVEHLVFKGTKTRSAFQLAKALESLGGELNAYTTREYTCYHAIVLKDHWKKALEILSDLATNMEISREDFVVEKSVILQEIAMGEDNLEELIYDVYFERTLGKNPLSRPILGTEKSISAMTLKQIHHYYRERYSGNNIILSAAGCLDHQELVEGAKEFLSSKKKRRFKKTRKKPSHKAIRAVYEKEAEQLHLLVGIPCPSFRDKYRFEAFVVNTLLGGGMTSKLYQSIREKRGLVYTIYSSLNTFEDFGLINIYAACEPKNMKAVIRGLVNEVKRVRKQGITENELEMFKTQVVGGILLGSDDIENRMTSVGVNEMVFEKYKPVEAIVEEIKEVTVKSVNEFMDSYLDLSEAGWLLMGGEASKFEDDLKNLKI